MATLDLTEQKTLIELIISDPSTFTRIKAILKPEYFDKKYQHVIEYLLNFSNEYNALPTIEQISTEARDEYHIINGITQNPNLQQSVLDSAENFCKQRALELAILEAADRVNNGQSTGIDKIIKDAQLISIKKDLGIDFWENQDEWLKHLEVEMGTVKTGWKTFDDMLDGGFNWGSLNYVVSVSGGGKSLCLANLGLSMSLMGYNVAYLTYELDKELVGKRIMAMASNIKYRDISFQKQKAIDTLNMTRLKSKPGIFRIINMPNGSTTQDLESVLQEVEIELNNSIQVIIVDYADLMRCNDKRIDPNNLHLTGKEIAEDLRALARERTRVGKNTLVLTASQIMKEAMDEMEYNLGQLAGSVAKSNTADLIFSVRTNSAMKQKGEYELKVLKARNAGCVDRKLRLKYNVDTLLMSDMEEVTESNPLNIPQQQNVSGALNVLNRLQQFKSGEQL